MNLNRLRNTDLLFQGLTEFLDSWFRGKRYKATPPFQHLLSNAIEKGPPGFGEFAAIVTNYPPAKWEDMDYNLCWPNPTPLRDGYIYMSGDPWGEDAIICSLNRSDFGQLYDLTEDVDEDRFELEPFEETVNEFSDSSIPP